MEEDGHKNGKYEGEGGNSGDDSSSKKPKRPRELDTRTSTTHISPPSKRPLQYKKSPTAPLNLGYSAEPLSVGGVIDHGRLNDDAIQSTAGDASDRLNQKGPEYLGVAASDLSKSTESLNITNLETFTRRPRHPSVDSLSYNRDSMMNSRLQLSKGYSKDSLDQDVSLSGSLCMDASMSESGDFSYDVSGTECESLSSSQYFPQQSENHGALEGKTLTLKLAPSPSALEDAVSSMIDKREEGFSRILDKTDNISRTSDNRDTILSSLSKSTDSISLSSHLHKKVSGRISSKLNKSTNDVSTSLYTSIDRHSHFLNKSKESISRAMEHAKKDDLVSSTSNSNKRHEGGKKRSKRSRHSSKKGAQKSENQGIDTANVRPNFFVGVQISNADIHKSIVGVQEDMVSHDATLMKALIDVATSHITLLVAHIDSEEALALASAALTKCGKRVSDDLSMCPLNLTFSGISHFGNQVVYAQLVEDDHHRRLLDLGECVRSVFAESGVCMPDTRTLHPHLTIAKLSKAPRVKGKHTPRKIDSSYYKQHLELEFGTQVVFGLQLLAMNKPKDQQRYFHNAAKVLFDIKTKENQDHSLCCFPKRPIHTPHLSSKPHHRSYTTATSTTTDKQLENHSENCLEDRNRRSVSVESEPSYFLPAIGLLMALAAGVVLALVVPRIRKQNP